MPKLLSEVRSLSTVLACLLRLIQDSLGPRGRTPVTLVKAHYALV